MDTNTKRSHSNSRTTANNRPGQTNNWMHLKEQLGEHSGQRHVCARCQLSYSQASNLRRHVAERHTGLAFSCSRCGFRSVRSDSVRRHVRTHHGAERERELAEKEWAIAEREAIVGTVLHVATEGPNMVK